MNWEVSGFCVHDHMISKPRQELPEETVIFDIPPIHMKCLLSKNIFVLSFL